MGLNPAGKPVILIYKEKADVPDLPDELEGVPVESTITGMLEPRDHSPQHRFPRPIPIGVSSGLAGVATGTLGARVTDGTRTFALSNNHVFAGVNTAAVGDPIIHPGDVDGGSDPSDRIGTLYAYETIDFDGSLNTMDAAIALTSAADVGTGTPCRRVRRSESGHSHGVYRVAGAEVRQNDGVPARERRGDRPVRRRLLHRTRSVLPAGGAFCRADLDLSRSFQRSRRLRLADRDAERESAGRTALRGRRRPDDRLPDRPGLAAVRRDDRGHAARKMAHPALPSA